MSRNIFVSYSRRDSEAAIQILASIEFCGLKAWYDGDMPIGADFGRVIEERIADSRWVLVIWSRNSVASEWVKKEATLALAQNKLRAVQIDDCELPAEFAHIHADRLAPNMMNKTALAFLFEDDTSLPDATTELSKLNQKVEAAVLHDATEEEWRIFLRQLISKRAHLIHKLRARDTTGSWVYYFIYVPQRNEKRFMRALNEGGISANGMDLENFGNVVAASYGDEPSEEVKTFLRTTYGFEV